MMMRRSQGLRNAEALFEADCMDCTAWYYEVGLFRELERSAVKRSSSSLHRYVVYILLIHLHAGVDSPHQQAWALRTPVQVTPSVMHRAFSS